MSFHLSSENIHLVDNHILVGQLKNEEGNLQESSIDLDQVLGNEDGHFEWGGVDFSTSAQNVRYSIEGGGAVPVLRAELQTADQNWRPADVNLAERIENINGRFEFI
ncbi:Cyanovirin-N [Sphaerosporella brunnea]|uniref:Cyanovirin-N n=1 Tax=Sphaerosporella brunnea TaxID=1250544 RepID=A0A5J5EDC0_9PEZI|nr:Cyanovirin-N [Sphaerosporella brunnea]